MMEVGKQTVDQRIREIMEEVDITQDIASAVCPNMWYSGNRLLANGEVDCFICRYHLAKHNRNDETQMILPYAGCELTAALKRHCEYHFEESPESCPGRKWREDQK